MLIIWLCNVKIIRGKGMSTTVLEESTVQWEKKIRKRVKR